MERMIESYRGKYFMSKYLGLRPIRLKKGGKEGSGVRLGGTKNLKNVLSSNLRGRRLFELKACD